MRILNLLKALTRVFAAPSAGQNVLQIKHLGSAFAVVAGGSAYSAHFNVAGLRAMSPAIKVSSLAVGNITAVTVEESWDSGTTWMTHTTWTAVPITTDGLYRKDGASEFGPLIRFKVTAAAGVTGNVQPMIGYIDASMDHPRSP